MLCTAALTTVNSQCNITEHFHTLIQFTLHLLTAVNIQGAHIEMEESFKYLGFPVNNKLDLAHNANALYMQGDLWGVVEGKSELLLIFFCSFALQMQQVFSAATCSLCLPLLFKDLAKQRNCLHDTSGDIRSLHILDTEEFKKNMN